MKRILTSLSIFSILFLSSCQKESGFSDTNNGSSGSSAGTLLIKTESKRGTETATTIYTYNASKKLINQKITGTAQGINVGNEYRYYRNASGIVTNYTQISAVLAQSGLDSLTTIVHYSNSKYTSTVSKITISGFSVLDSMTFIYDAGGKIIRSDLYQALPTISGYELTATVKYTYSANGNLMQQQYYTHDPTTSSDDLFATVKYTFDTKTSPLIVAANEAFALGHPDWLSVNNGTKIELIDASDPINNQTIGITYTYNSNNRPATSVNTTNPGNIVENATYFYQ